MGKRLVLVDGNIPAGAACPWHSECTYVFEACPTETKPRTTSFSCASARSFAMSEESRERKAAKERK
jgi:hypothetical protein